MKRTLVILLGALLALSPAVAQKLPEPSFYHPSIAVGGRIGASLSFLDIRPSINQGIHYGGLAGASFQIENSPYTGAELSLMYALRGWTEAYPDAEEPLAYSCYLHCVNLPLSLMLYYPFGNFRMGLKAGPSIGAIFAVRAKQSGDAFPEEDALRHKLPIVGRFTWGVAAGPYFSYSFGKHRIELDGRFYYSFNNLFSAKLGDVYARSAEMVVEITAAYLFRVY